MTNQPNYLFHLIKLINTYLASRRGRLGGGGGKSPPRPEPRQTSLPLGVPRARSTETL